MEDKSFTSQLLLVLRRIPEEIARRLTDIHGLGKNKDESCKAWNDKQSTSGQGATALERVGFSAGKFLPELGQLAGFSRDMRELFSALQGLSVKVKVDESERHREAAKSYDSPATSRLQQQHEQWKQTWDKTTAAQLAGKLDMPAPGWALPSQARAAEDKPAAPSAAASQKSQDEASPAPPTKQPGLAWAAPWWPAQLNIPSASSALPVASPPAPEKCIDTAFQQPMYPYPKPPQRLANPPRSPPEWQRPDWAQPGKAEAAGQTGGELGPALPGQPPQTGQDQASRWTPGGTLGNALSGGTQAASFGPMVQLLAEIVRQNAEILKALQGMERANKDNDEDETESVENLPPEQRPEGPTQFEFGQGQPNGNGKQGASYSALRSMGREKKGGGLKTMLELIQIMEAI